MGNLIKYTEAQNSENVLDMLIATKPGPRNL
jgi:hypothetical protein